MLIAVVAPLARAAPADDVKALFERGDARAAFELGLRNPAAFGNPAFDYYYGMAAIDSGAPAEGVLALERYLLNNPGSVSARLELGRGYLLMGDYPRAREVFEEVRALSPPAAVERRIAAHLAAIREKESAYRTSVSGFVEAGIGHDSNVNGGISSETISVPLFGPIVISADGRETSDSFTGMSAGVQVNVPVSARMALFAGLGADYRAHAHAGAFDQRSVGGAAGVSFRRADDQFRVSASGGILDVDYERYRALKATTLEWNRNLDPRRGFALFVQAADVDYRGDNRVRDGRLYSAGASWRQSIEGDWQPFLSLGLVGGREQNVRDRDDLARNLYGVRVGLGLTLAPRVNAAFSINGQRSFYQETDPFFSVRRNDRYLSVEGALGYMIDPSLGVRLEVSRTDNRSNIDLFEYQRTLVAVKLRYEFK